jgi:hypothetical protein
MITVTGVQTCALPICVDADYWARKRDLNPADAVWVSHIIDGET